MADHKISLCFYQGGEVDDHDAVDHSHKRNNTMKVKTISESDNKKVTVMATVRADVNSNWRIIREG